MLFQRRTIKRQLKERTNKKIERICSQNKENEWLSPIDQLQELTGKVSFYTPVPKEKIKKASIAVETILVLPIFFLGIVTMISFMDIYSIQTEHLVKLCETVKEAGMYAYVLNDKGPEEIQLPDVYSYEPVGGIVALSKVWMHNLVKVHAWTGKEYASTEQSEEEIEEMVYVTESGEVYHKDLGCSYLSVSVISVSGNIVEYLKNDYGNSYGACASCSHGKDPAAIVYVTEKGTNYHNDESCSALKRTVRMVKHSHAGEMAPCSRCG